MEILLINNKQRKGSVDDSTQVLKRNNFIRIELIIYNYNSNNEFK